MSPENPEDPAPQTLMRHLTDLRRAIIRSLAALVIGMLGCLYFSKEIFHFLQQPLLSVMPQGSSFIATNPLEAFFVYLKVSLLAGFFAASPFILSQVWWFVAPALYQKEKKLAVSFVFFSTVFFVGGALFGYALIFPVGFKFFVAALEGTGIQFLPKMEDYLGFLSKMLLTFGFVFEIPILLILLARMGLVTVTLLNRAQRYVLVATFLIAGVLTPGPDVLSQLLLAVPLLLLYELSVLAVWMMERRPHPPRFPG